MRTRFANGAHYCPYAPLGYRMDPDQKGHLLINPVTRWIVEKIYDLAYHGIGAHRINKMLIAEEVPTATYLIYQENGRFSELYEGQPESRKYEWGVSQVKKILQDEVYIGNSVHGRLASVSFKDKRKMRQPEEKWYRVENTHEAIISKEVFDHVQKQIASRRRERKNGTVQIFAGLVKCADCGHAMQFGTNHSPHVTWSHFSCSTFCQKGKSYCTNHYIRYDTLYGYVLSRIQFWVKQSRTDKASLLKRLSDAGELAHKSAHKSALAALRKAEKRQKELDALFAKLYEDRLAGKISEYNFSALSAKYQKEQAEAAETVQTLTETIHQSKQQHLDAEKWVALIQQYENPTELTAPMLNSLIEKITVHQAVKQEDGTKEQQVDIYYRFVGKID